MKKQISRLVDHANVIAPSIIYYEEEHNYGKVTDENFDFDAFVSWKMEAKSILLQLSNFNPTIFSDLYTIPWTSQNTPNRWK